MPRAGSEAARARRLLGVRRGVVGVGAALAWLVALPWGAAGCEGSPCDTDPDKNPPVAFRGGRLDAEQRVYETSSASGQHLNFSSGAQFKIYHQLGGCPRLVQPWVSFSSTGTRDGNEALPSGNMLEVIEVTDEYVWVRNDGCADFWLRLVAAAPGPCGG